MVVKILLILLLLPCLISTEPVELTGRTWKHMLGGQWMVEFYAPWCSACKQFKPIWNDFSRAMISKDIKVGAVDVDKHQALSARFRITTLPTIYYVRDGLFRVYNGERSLNALKNYIENQEWKRTEALSSFAAPDSFVVSFTNAFFDISVAIKNAVTFFQDRYGWPLWFIIVVFAVTVFVLSLVLGFIFITIIDYCVAARSVIIKNNVPKDNQELDTSDSQKLLKPEIQIDNPSVEDENQDNEVLPTDQNDNASEELNTSDVILDTNKDEEQSTTDQTVRQRRLNK